MVLGPKRHPIGAAVHKLMLGGALLKRVREIELVLLVHRARIGAMRANAAMVFPNESFRVA